MPSPMLQTTLMAAGLSAASNILAQFLEAYRSAQPMVFDFPSFLRFVVLTFITAPPNYLWQQFLERKWPAYEREPGPIDIEKQDGLGDDDDYHDIDGGHSRRLRGEHQQKSGLNKKNTFLKFFTDCITLGAIFNTVAFFVLMGILKRQALDQIVQNIRTQTIPVIVAGYKIWPFASLISFSCVPVERRVVFLSFVGLLWGIYMSLVATRV
ncbi:hypothetical protein F4778DRAFT_786265 [Xylariomycetidae sp. FL2044]|nr:hypothetical protein F4778DRAFT_786265 [Xylariomycetidae sp. FL2044]